MWVTERAVEYWVDGDNRLAAFDEEFRAFAVVNGAPEVASDSILGGRISSFCSHDATIETWTQLLARAREGASVALQVRCDSPERRRLLRLDLTVLEGRRIRVLSTTLSEEARSPVALLHVDRRERDTLLACCRGCKKWRLPTGTWVEAEELVAALHPFEEAVLPGVSHGICEECEASFRKGGRA
jgi:hypothetical protein